MNLLAHTYTKKLIFIFIMIAFPSLCHANDLYWLTKNIYYEARGEDQIGKIMVGLVTINRAIEKQTSIKRIVNEPNQFSWKKNRVPVNKTAWEQCKKAARLAIKYSVKLPESSTYRKITHYHSTKVRPYWSKVYKKVVQIGNHIFYEKDNG